MVTRSKDPILGKTRSGGVPATVPKPSKTAERKRKKESRKERERKEAEKRQKLDDRYAVVKANLQPPSTEANIQPPSTEQEDSDGEECLETGQDVMEGGNQVDEGSGDVGRTGKGGRDSVGDETSTLRAQIEEMTRVTQELQRKLSEIAVPSNVTADIEKMSQAATTITRDSGISLASMMPDAVENSTRQGSRVVGVTANAVITLSEIQQIALMEDVEKHEELKDQLEKYVNKTVFPSTKFPVGKEKEEKLCRIALRIRERSSCRLVLI